MGTQEQIRTYFGDPWLDLYWKKLLKTVVDNELKNKTPKLTSKQIEVILTEVT